MKVPLFSPNLLLATAALFSGAAALIYETLWTRGFALVLGSTIQAAAITFAAFLAGLSLGAYVCGRYSHRWQHTVRVYILSELAIALLAPAVGLLLHHHGTWLAVSMGASVRSPFLMFPVVLVLISLPTFAMGATFPLMLLAARRLGGSPVVISLLYGCNTLGGALGTLACAFYLIPWLGITTALLATGGLNLLAGVLCLPLTRYPLPNLPDWRPAAAPSLPSASRPKPLPPTVPAADTHVAPASAPSSATDADVAPTSAPISAADVDVAPASAPSSTADTPGTSAPAPCGSSQASAAILPSAPVPTVLLLLVAAVSGFVVLGMEVVWIRLADYYTGNRTYAFALLLSAVLLLLACGSWLAQRLYQWRRERAARLCPWILLLAAAAIALGSSLSWWWILHQGVYEPRLPGYPSTLIWLRFGENLLLLAPLLLPLGMLFPLALTCAPRTAQATGRSAGEFYLVNTVGAIAGSLLVGFGGVTTVGTFGSAYLLAFSCLALAFFLFLHQVIFKSAHFTTWAGLTCSLLLLCILRVPHAIALTDAPDEKIIFRQEDAYGVFQVIKTPQGHLKVTNNRTHLVFHLGTALTSYVQQMQGHLGLFHRPQAQTALVLGSGYGITAGALGLYPLKRVDAVEILPAMVQAAPLFAPYNLYYHRNPRISVIVDDGRHYLARGQQRYDIVSINITDPHLPGGAALFHRDFYTIVKQHLTPRGVVLQHAFGADLVTVLATMRRSFTYLRLYPAYRNGFNVVAADTPLRIPAKRLRQLLRHNPRVTQALYDIGFVPPLDPVAIFAHGLTPEDLPWLFPANAPIATDDHPLIEFAWNRDPRMLLFTNE